jgi:hypothetical protein
MCLASPTTASLFLIQPPTGRVCAGFAGFRVRAYKEYVLFSTIGIASVREQPLTFGQNHHELAWIMALFKGGATTLSGSLQSCIEIHSQIFSDIGFIYQVG